MSKSLQEQYSLRFPKTNLDMPYPEYYDEVRESRSYYGTPVSRENFEALRAPSPPRQGRYYGSNRTHRSHAAPRSINTSNQENPGPRNVERHSNAPVARSRKDYGDDATSKRGRSDSHANRETSLTRYVTATNDIDHAEINEFDASDKRVLGWLDSIEEDSSLDAAVPPKPPSARSRVDSHSQNVRPPLEELHRSRRNTERSHHSTRDDRAHDDRIHEDRINAYVQPFQSSSPRASAGPEVFVPQSWDGTIIRVPANYSIIVPPSYQVARMGDDIDRTTEALRRHSIPSTAAHNDSIYTNSRRYRIRDDLDY